MRETLYLGTTVHTCNKKEAYLQKVKYLLFCINLKNVHNTTCTILQWINVTFTEIVPEKGRCRRQ